MTRLTGREASRTGEWRQGIGRLLAAQLGPEIRGLLAPYLEAIARYNPGGRLLAYPGSPLLALSWLRPQDRLIACELVPAAAAALARALGKDRRAKVITIDGWTALAAYVPPRERRGLVLIDPPFEASGEFDRLVEHLARAHRKWATGTYLLWYPIKDVAETGRFAFDRQRTFAGQSAVATRNRAAKPASRARRGAPPRPAGRRAARLARRGKMR